MKQRFNGFLLGVLTLSVLAALGATWKTVPAFRAGVWYWWRYANAPPLSPEALGSGSPASDLLLLDPVGLSADSAGNVYISDRGRNFRGRMIWKVDDEGRAQAVAGTGRRGTPGKRVQPPSPDLSRPQGLAVDSRGRVLFTDEDQSLVLRTESDGSLTRVAGTGDQGYHGDGGPAREAHLNHPVDLRIDTWGNIYIADVYNHRVRKISPGGVITTVAGTGTPGYAGDGGPATDAQLNMPWGIYIDAGNRLLIADSENHVIRQVDQHGIISTIAGTGQPGFSGDGGPARSAQFNSPQSLFVDPQGRMYVGDEHNHAIRIIGTDGIVTTLMGTGLAGFATDGAHAADAALNDPENLLVRTDGSVLVTDGDNGRVLRIAPDGRVRTFAGRGTARKQPRS